MEDPPRLLDATGYRCPLPVILMEKALRAMDPGGRLKVIADDPIAAVDIPHFCRQAGHLAERLASEPEVCVFLVTAKENKGR
ncbi:MAG: sulfurtransferase TusA family protein [Parvularculaceae bacterium]|jgi:tRNA 2-thiouridine synthesizing protein A|nr:sulfurtransferase TusA family protein [Parvularculaceae bacterium]